MENPHQAYLQLLENLSGVLEHLSDLARQKADVVRKDNLTALNDVLKQEQAATLNLRGLEQKRVKLLAELGMEKTPLSELADRFPAELRTQAKQTVDTLRRNYEIYHSAAEVARNTLECNLHEVEKVIESLGVVPAEGIGYNGEPVVEPPKRMKTDFRA